MKTSTRCKRWRKLANLDYTPTSLTLPFRMAMEGKGDLAYTWKDKPHRLIFKLCRILEEMSHNLNPEEE